MRDGKGVAMAVTTKARAKGLLRDVRLLLADRALPQEIGEALTAVAAALRKNWADLEAEAGVAVNDQPAAEAQRGGAAEDDALSEAERSHGRVRQLLQLALNPGRAGAGAVEYGWVCDVFDTWFVYNVEPDGGTYKRPYVIADNDTVTMGEPEKVLPTTVYVPVSEAVALAERQMDKNVGGGVDRDKIPDEDFAGKNRSFPIVRPGDVADAAASIGRAGPDNYSTDELKRRIIAIAKRKGKAFVAQLPEKWQEEMQESGDRDQPVPWLRQDRLAKPGESELTGEVVPLVERAVRRDGTARVKLITPGWGASGYYPAEVLQRDGPQVFKAGMHMYVDHPTPTQEAERPERSLREMAAVLVSDARWEESQTGGPGLYADAKVFSDFRPVLEELAPHIGASIVAGGQVRMGEAEGRQGPIVEKIVKGRSVDFVTQPGAGGRVMELYEAARQEAGVRSQESACPGEARGGRSQEGAMDEKELKELRDEKARLAQEAARLREALLLREARDVAADELAKIEMPAPTRERLVAAAVGKPIVKDGQLDRDAYVRQVQEAAAAELEYLARATGSGRIVGMGGNGGGQENVDVAAVEKQMADAFQRIGLKESTAGRAAKGRP